MKKDEWVSIHHKKIQGLAVEIFKIKNCMSLEIAFDIFLQGAWNHDNQQNDFLLPFILSSILTKLS